MFISQTYCIVFSYYLLDSARLSNICFRHVRPDYMLLLCLWCYYAYVDTMIMFMRLLCCSYHEIPFFHNESVWLMVVLDEMWYMMWYVDTNPWCDQFNDFMWWKEMMLIIWTNWWLDIDIVMNACFAKYLSAGNKGYVLVR